MSKSNSSYLFNRPPITASTTNTKSSADDYFNFSPTSKMNNLLIRSSGWSNVNSKIQSGFASSTNKIPENNIHHIAGHIAGHNAGNNNQGHIAGHNAGNNNQKETKSSNIHSGLFSIHSYNSKSKLQAGSQSANNLGGVNRSFADLRTRQNSGNTTNKPTMNNFNKYDTISNTNSNPNTQSFNFSSSNNNRMNAKKSIFVINLADSKDKQPIPLSAKEKKVQEDSVEEFQRQFRQEQEKKSYIEKFSPRKRSTQL